MEVKNLHFHLLKQYNNDQRLIKYSPVINSPYYEMQVGTSRGLLAKNQSASTIGTHPKDSKLICMIISYNNKETFESERISERIVIELNILFQSLPKESFYDIKNIQNIIICYLRGLNKKLKLSNEYVLNASLGMVIKGDKETLILTLGSATCYIINDNKLNEIETIKNTEIHHNKLWLKPDITIIPNSYESILLTSSTLSKKVVSEYADESSITESLDKMISSHINSEEINYKIHRNRNITAAMYKNSSK